MLSPVPADALPAGLLRPFAIGQAPIRLGRHARRKSNKHSKGPASSFSIPATSAMAAKACGLGSRGR
jgi:hypothetical protein